MNQASLSYLAFGVLVAGGVPLRDLPEIAEPEVAATKEVVVEDRQPVVQGIKKSHGLMAWIHHSVPAH